MKKFNYLAEKQRNKRNNVIGNLRANKRKKIEKDMHGNFGHNWIREIITYLVADKKKVTTKVFNERKHASLSWRDNLPKGQKTYKPKRNKK